MKRSDEQKRAFALKCQEIEKAGGDVLGYIELYWPSYTPRACWYNLQKQYLLRERHQLTEGKLKSRGKEEEAMRRNRETILEGVLEVLDRQGDPIEYMKEQGYANPHQAFVDLRNWANAHGKNQGRLPANLNTYYSDIRRQKDNPPPAEEKPGENPTETQTTVETIFFGGKEYEKLEGENTPVNEYREKPSPTCQPKPEEIKKTFSEANTAAQNIVKGLQNIAQQARLEKFPKKDHLPVCGVQGTFGRFESGSVGEFQYMAFITEDRITHTKRELTFGRAQWEIMIEEIRMALQQLQIPG